MATYWLKDDDMKKDETSKKQHFELTKKNLIIVTMIFLFCIGIPVVLLLNI